MLRALWGVLLAVLLIAPSAAHEVRPALLRLIEVGPSSYDVTWKRPELSGQAFRLSPVFPGDCEITDLTTRSVAGARVDRGVLRCTDTLSGREVGFDRLSEVAIDALVQVELASGDTQSVVLRGAQDRVTVAEIPTTSGVLRSYFELGVEHILEGIDHLLFVLGLFLVVSGGRQLLGAITAFTVAHSITLALASLGLVSVPQAPVEAVIALSIALLAAEIVQKEPGMTAKRPWMVAFAVGLLHGLGFAGALSEIGLPASQIPAALFSFNVGVEFGQILFLGVLGFVAWSVRKLPMPAWGRSALAYGLGSLACFWVVERTVAFL